MKSKAKKEKLTVLFYGGGQDSEAILRKLIHEAAFRKKYAPGRLLVLMSATGDEHAHTDQHVERTKALCATQGIEFVHLIPAMGFHSPLWQDLRSYYNAKRTCGSKAFPKTCTDQLKIRPSYRFLESWISREYGIPAGRKAAFKKFAELNGRIRVLIGFAAGEESRVAADSTLPPWMAASLERQFPLIDLGMDRAACQKYIASLGAPVPFPSNCRLCPFMSEQELVWLARFFPADLADWIRIEKNKIKANLHMGEKNLGVWGRKLLPVKVAEAHAKYGSWSDAELMDYKMSHGHCVKSKY